MKSRGALISPDSNMRLTSPWAGKIRTWFTDWRSCNKNKTWNILRSWTLSHECQSYKFSGAHAGVRIRRANLPLSPLDLGGEPHKVSGQPRQYDLDLVHTETPETPVWSCMILILILKAYLYDLSRHRNLRYLLPETPCKRHVQIVGSWAEILHFLAWRIEDICMWI